MYPTEFKATGISEVMQGKAAAQLTTIQGRPEQPPPTKTTPLTMTQPRVGPIINDCPGANPTILFN